MNFDFTKILLAIIVFLFSIIAIKVTLSFNLNEYLKRRDKKLKGKIKNYCTHANIKNFDDVIGIESSFISPSGTTNWICEKCGLQIYHLDKKGEKRKFEYFFKNPKKFKKQEKKFQKLLKKAGFL